MELKVNKMKNAFEDKVANEFNRERNYNKIMLKTERKMYMKKIGYILAPVCAVALVAVGVVGFSNMNNIRENNPSNIVSLANNIRINQIQNIAATKLMVDSRMIEKEDLPSELGDISNVGGSEASMVSAYYTKSDYSKEEFDVLHDYVLLFITEGTNKVVKVSASKLETPLRDYFFDTVSEDMSNIDGHNVKISKYEDKYIINFEKGDYHYDIETNGLAEDEMLNVLREVLKK